ncbi:MAG: TIGR04282 family arsenosugar biosynthesis glycosyltransferase [Anaerolineales bacterium]
MRRHLIVYARAPLPERTKTRLGAGLGAEAAAGIYARLLYGYLYDLLRAPLPDLRLELSVSTPTERSYFTDAFPEFEVTSQVGGDLGRRMWASFCRAFERGSESVVLTGSDLPGLSTHHVQAALEALEEVPVVLGPATDGGYYLVGMRSPGADLFQGISWSTERVLAQTEALAQQEALTTRRVSTLQDIDVTAEYVLWREQLLEKR